MKPFTPEKPLTPDSLLPEALFIVDILAWITPCRHKTDVSVALCLGYQEWLDVGLWECFRVSKEGANLRKWHEAIKGDMVQLSGT